VGINSALYYAPFLFQQIGAGSTAASLLSNVIDGVILNVVTLPNMYYTDTWGRRRPMILGAIAMGICMLMIGVLLTTEGNPSYDASTHKVNFNFDSNIAAGKAVLAFLYLYVASFAISWATPAWIVPAECFPMASRARCNSMATATNWFVNFWFALYLPTALDEISWKVYIMFAVICFAAAIWCFFLQVETANRSLESIDKLFEPQMSMFPFMDKRLTSVHPIRDHKTAVDDTNEQRPSQQLTVGGNEQDKEEGGNEQLETV